VIQFNPLYETLIKPWTFEPLGYISSPSHPTASFSPVLLWPSRTAVRVFVAPRTMSHDLARRTLSFLSDMDYKQLAALGGTVAVVYGIYRRYAAISLDDVPGPENPSFLHGMLHPGSRFCFHLSGASQDTSRFCKTLRQGNSSTIT